MPRAALLSIHARVEGTTPTVWEEAPLVQVWGPRYSAYVIAAADRAVFTVGRLPDEGGSRRAAEDIATRLDAFLDGRVMGAGEAARGIGVRHPNALRYGAPTGRILIRWDGARRPTVWTVPPPTIDPLDARQELVRRYIHVFGPTTPEAFAEWAGVSSAVARTTFAGLAPSLVPVRGPIGDGWILSSDEATFRAPLPRSPRGVDPTTGGGTFFLVVGRPRTSPNRVEPASVRSSRVPTTRRAWCRHIPGPAARTAAVQLSFRAGLRPSHADARPLSDAVPRLQRFRRDRRPSEQRDRSDNSVINTDPPIGASTVDSIGQPVVSRSIRAAMMKSLRESPPTEWVDRRTTSRPQPTSSSG
jgi:hypothetical protein